MFLVCRVEKGEVCVVFFFHSPPLPTSVYDYFVLLFCFACSAQVSHWYLVRVYIRVSVCKCVHV